MRNLQINEEGRKTLDQDFPAFLEFGGERTADETLILKSISVSLASYQRFKMLAAKKMPLSPLHNFQFDQENRKAGKNQIQTFLHSGLPQSLKGEVLRHLHLRLVIVFASLCGQFSVFATDPLPNPKIEALPQSAALSTDTPAKVELGRLLFFDPILSATREVACATCHHPQHGWADARPTPLGVHASGLGPQRRLAKNAELLPLTRNTPSLLNVAFNGIASGQPFDPKQSPMFWDNRVQGLESQALSPIRQREEMRGDVCSEAQAVPALIGRLQALPEYVKRFGGQVTADKVADAIAAYERTLITPDSPFDRFMRGDKTAMTPAQQHGMEVFRRAGCSLCHNGPMLSDYKLHAIGLTDSSTSRHEFRTPTLRNLKHTAPYMHHGGHPTLDDVLLFYDRLMDHAAETLEGGDSSTLPQLDPLLRKMNMLPEDHEPLRAFLDALNSDDYDKTVPKSVPSGLPVPAAVP